jgi:hypothetical protein
MQQSSLTSQQLLSHQINSQNAMEPEGSLPRSQEPDISPPLEPDEFSPYLPIILLTNRNLCNKYEIFGSKML